MFIKKGCIILVSTEQKLQLLHAIREDSQRNRMLIRRREKIIYGTSIEEPYEVVDDEYTIEKELSLNKEKGISGFRIRFLISVILFLSFFYLDRNQEKIGHIDTNQIEVYVDDNSLVGLISNVFDFEK